MKHNALTSSVTLSCICGPVLLCWPLHHLLSLVLGWFLTRMPTVQWLDDLFLLFFARIVFRFGYKNVVSSSVCCNYCFEFENSVCGLCFGDCSVFPPIFGYHPCMLKKWDIILFHVQILYYTGPKFDIFVFKFLWKFSSDER